MTIRSQGLAAEVEELPSEHHTTALVAFDEDGWELSEEAAEAYGDPNPFLWSGIGTENGFPASDERLTVHYIVDNASEVYEREGAFAVDSPQGEENWY